MPQDGLHLDQVHDAFEVLFRADGNLDRTRVGTQDIPHLLHSLEEVRTRAVHLVDITDAGDIVFVSLTPYGFRLGLNAIGGRICSDGSIEHTQRTFHLGSEVHVPRGVDQIDLIGIALVVPVAGGCSRRNRNTSFLLLGHPVHGGGTIMHLTNLVSLARIEQNTLRSCCLTGIDVRHDTDITSQM